MCVLYKMDNTYVLIGILFLAIIVYTYDADIKYRIEQTAKSKSKIFVKTENYCSMCAGK